MNSYNGLDKLYKTILKNDKTNKNIIGFGISKIRTRLSKKYIN